MTNRIFNLLNALLISTLTISVSGAATPLCADNGKVTTTRPRPFNIAAGIYDFAAAFVNNKTSSGYLASIDLSINGGAIGALPAYSTSPSRLFTLEKGVIYSLAGGKKLVGYERPSVKGKTPFGLQFVSADTKGVKPAKYRAVTVCNVSNGKEFRRIELRSVDASLRWAATYPASQTDTKYLANVRNTTNFNQDPPADGVYKVKATAILVDK